MRRNFHNIHTLKVSPYVDFDEDDNFGYLAIQLCKYTLEEYIQEHLPDDCAERNLVLKKLVKEVLCSLQ
ncbi:hypothetical protein ABG768_025787, partial [Culter alburnus]